MTRKASIARVAAGLIAGAAIVATAEGHEVGPMRGMGPGGPMMGPGMMGQMGPGMMMTPGMMGPGMMGQGGPMMGPGMMWQMAPGMMGGGQPGMMMGPGMMGQGMAPGMMGHMGGGLRITPGMHLTTDDVRYSLERYLSGHGFEHLKVGEITQTDPDTITADVVTTDGSLAVRLQVDTHTGWIKDLS